MPALERRHPYSEDDWELAEAVLNGNRHVIRQRASLPAIADRELFCHLILIVWEYQGSAMPDSETHSQMKEVEDALEAGTEKRGIGVQVFSMTGSGRKEWRYYTSNVDDFLESLNADLAVCGQLPLKIESWLDPEWNGLLEYRSSNDA